MGLARNTVVAAYDQLLAEGIIEGRVGAGSYVSRDLPQGLEPPPRQEGSAAPAAPGALPRAAQRYATAVPAVGSYGTEPCNTGRTSWEERTALVWRGLTLRRLQAPNPAMLGYADPRGSLALRAEIAGYLRAARAVRCEPDQIIVTAGAQQAIDLVLKVLVEPGDPVWVEDPATRRCAPRWPRRGPASCRCRWMRRGWLWPPASPPRPRRGSPM
ncbi:aminotransferase class I/II-fold pyridoxal phosphate-dependent enzyme [Siccirubricoccus deserti]